MIDRNLLFIRDFDINFIACNALFALLSLFATCVVHCILLSNNTPRTFIWFFECIILPFSSKLIWCKSLVLRIHYPFLASFTTNPKSFKSFCYHCQVFFMSSFSATRVVFHLMKKLSSAKFAIPRKRWRHRYHSYT